MVYGCVSGGLWWLGRLRSREVHAYGSRLKWFAYILTDRLNLLLYIPIEYLVVAFFYHGKVKPATIKKNAPIL